MEELHRDGFVYDVALVVEDEPLVRTLAAEILMDAGYRVFEACNASEAMEILSERSDVHIVVTDIEMPGTMDGVALAATIHDRWPGIVTVVNSGRVKPDAGSLPAGTGFIAKPYRAEELVGQITQMVAERASRAAR